MKTPIKGTVKEAYIEKGNYEGYDYYRMVIRLAEGFTLKCKLTEYEYKSLTNSKMVII